MSKQAELAPLTVLQESQRRHVYPINAARLKEIGTSQQVFDLLKAADSILRFNESAQQSIAVHEWNITVQYFTTADSRQTIMRQIGANYPQRVTQITAQVLKRAKNLLPPEEQRKYPDDLLVRGKSNLANVQAQERRYARNPTLRHIRWRKSAENPGRRAASSRALHLLRQDEAFNRNVMAVITAPETRAAAEATRRARYFNDSADLLVENELFFPRRQDRSRLQKEHAVVISLKAAIQHVLNTATGPINSMDLSHSVSSILFAEGIHTVARVHILKAMHELRREGALSFIATSDSPLWLGFIPTTTAALEARTNQHGLAFPNEATPVERILEAGNIAVNVPFVLKAEPDAIKMGVCVYEDTPELDETGQRKRSSILNVYNNGLVSLSIFNGRTYTQVFKGIPSQLLSEQQDQVIDILRTAQQTLAI